MCFRTCDSKLIDAAFRIGGFWGRVIGVGIGIADSTRDAEADDPICSQKGRLE